MVYINSIGFISPQNTIEGDFSCSVKHGGEHILRCIEPEYKTLINPVQLRRMSRILKLGLGASQHCLNAAQNLVPDAIVVGTGMACINDLEVFLKSIIDENEQALSPIPFINSSHNTVGAQIARTHKVQAYNNTHCHRGASFENALLDALMLLGEDKAANVLLGGIDEFSMHYYTMNYDRMFRSDTNPDGAVAGEGAGFFLLGKAKTDRSFATVAAAKTFFNPPSNFILDFLAENELKTTDIDALMLGTNGSPADDEVYNQTVERDFSTQAIIGFKHLCGEYTTASAFALALAATALKNGEFPASSLIKQGNRATGKVLIYNHYRQKNHTLVLLDRIS